MKTRLAAIFVTLAASALPALAKADQSPPTTSAQPKCVVQAQIENGQAKNSALTCFDQAGNVVSQNSVRLAIFDKDDGKAKLLMAQYYGCDPRFYNCGYGYDGGYYYGGGGYGGYGGRGGGGFERGGGGGRGGGFERGGGGGFERGGGRGFGGGGGGRGGGRR